MLHDLLSKTTLATRTTAFLGDYLPRKCGIATFTSGPLGAVAEQNPQSLCFAVPVVTMLLTVFPSRMPARSTTQPASEVMIERERTILQDVYRAQPAKIRQFIDHAVAMDEEDRISRALRADMRPPQG